MMFSALLTGILNARQRHKVKDGHEIGKIFPFCALGLCLKMNLDLKLGNTLQEGFIR